MNFDLASSSGRETLPRTGPHTHTWTLCPLIKKRQWGRTEEGEGRGAKTRKQEETQTLVLIKSLFTLISQWLRAGFLHVYADIYKMERRNFAPRFRQKKLPNIKGNNIFFFSRVHTPLAVGRSRHYRGRSCLHHTEDSCRAKVAFPRWLS